MVDPIIGTKRLTKVLMDGGSGLNIIYAETLVAMGVSRSYIQPTGAPLHGIVPGKQDVPVGQIDLPVTFGTPLNFRRKTLTFEVIDFHGTYHAILGRPCYAKFMAIPNYVYLKLKMPGPKGVITVGTSVQRAYECDHESCGMAAAAIASLELLATHGVNTEEMPSSAPAAKTFEFAVKTKKVLIDPNGPAEMTVCISAHLDPK